MGMSWIVRLIGATRLSITTFSITTPSPMTLNIKGFSRTTLCHNAECHYAECHYAECHYAECHYAECYYAEYRYAECLSVGQTSHPRRPDVTSAKCFTTVRRGASPTVSIVADGFNCCQSHILGH